MQNGGWRLCPIAEEANVEEIIKIRGFAINKEETRVIEAKDAREEIVTS